MRIIITSKIIHLTKLSLMRYTPPKLLYHVLMYKALKVNTSGNNGKTSILDVGECEYLAVTVTVNRLTPMKSHHGTKQLNASQLLTVPVFWFATRHIPYTAIIEHISCDMLHDRTLVHTSICDLLLTLILSSEQRSTRSHNHLTTERVLNHWMVPASWKVVLPVSRSLRHLLKSMRQFNLWRHVRR